MRGDDGCRGGDNGDTGVLLSGFDAVVVEVKADVGDGRVVGVGSKTYHSSFIDD